MAAHGLFVTGTDTGIGKTRAACALLHAASGRGLRALGMKPVATGAMHAGADEHGLMNDDVEQLAAASTFRAPADLVNPYCFEPAIAPALAAAQAGVTLDLDIIVRAYAALAAQADIVVVEGIGGFQVPLNAREDSADLAARLALPVILVVGVRLGCLNHALLTAGAIRARALCCAGWIANCVDPAMTAADLTIEALRSRMAAPLLGVIPHGAGAAAAATHLDWSALGAMLD